MCTKEETKKIVDEAENRMEKRLQQSHSAIAATVSAFGGEVKQATEASNEAVRTSRETHEMLQQIDWDSLKLVISSYNGVTTIKSVIVGLASVILSLGAIGAGLTWVIKHLK